MSKENNLSEYYRRASFSLKLMRYIVLIMFIVFIITIMFSMRNTITVDNIQYLMKYADFYNPVTTQATAEFSISSSSDSSFHSMRNNLAVVSKNGIGMYDFSGRKLFNYGFSYSSPAAVCDDRNILVYDIEGTEISIFNTFSRLYTQKFPYSVKAAAINQNGFAVVTNEKSYRSGVIVFNDKYKEIFRWMSPDMFVTAVELHKSASKVVYSAVTTHDGAYKSTIYIYDTITGNIENQVLINDELPVAIKYSLAGDKIVVFTDSMIRFYTETLQEIATHKYNQSKILNFTIENDSVVITESTSISGNSVQISAFDFDGKKFFSDRIPIKINDISMGENILYAIGDQQLFAYEFSQDNTVNKHIFDTGSNFKTIIADSENRYIIANSKKVLRGEISSNTKNSKDDSKK